MNCRLNPRVAVRRLVAVTLASAIGVVTAALMLAPAFSTAASGFHLDDDRYSHGN